jgi:two-component system response regulator WspF
MKIALAMEKTKVIEKLQSILADYEIIWTTCNGSEAIQKCIGTLPDLLFMSINFMDMEGTQAISSIMKATPCAILIATESLEQDAPKIFEAMGYGALDVVHIQRERENLDAMEVDKILKKINNFKIILRKKISLVEKNNAFFKDIIPLILIGASTGGPLALSKILSSLPENFKGSVIIVQHVDDQFVDDFANWLRQQTHLKIELAKDGSRPSQGKILIARTNQHLIMTKDLSLKYTVNPQNCVYKPSIDVLFNSVAEHWPDKSIAILLTGMGKDGAQGLKTLLDAGWHTIVENEESCVIFGMPKAAIEMKAAKIVLPLKNIATEIGLYLKAKLDCNPWRTPE